MTTPHSPVASTAPTVSGRTTAPSIQAVDESAAPRGRLMSRLIAAPLLTKLVVCDLALNGIALVIVSDAPAEFAAEITIAALLVTLVINAVLVYWALLPLRELEEAASRVSAGRLEARVRYSTLADRNILRIAKALNQLLDHVTADRVRMRHLASQVISAGDQERAHIARELHDSTAQSLSALEMLVTSSLRETPPGALHERLAVMREITTESLTEVRTLSHNVHPRVLDDLGLTSALEFLARRTREGSGIAVRVVSDVKADIPHAVASVLYRVAQEAVRNAVRHGQPKDMCITVSADGRLARIEIEDDGGGFDVAATDAARGGMGLFLMRERLALISGTLDIESRPGRTVIRAAAPMDGEAGQVAPVRRPVS